MQTNQAQLISRSPQWSDTQLIQQWVQRKPPQLRRGYWHAAKQFQRFIRKPFAQVTLADIQAFAIFLIGRKKPLQLRQAIVAVKSLLIFGNRFGLIPLSVPPRWWPKLPHKRRSSQQLFAAQFHRLQLPVRFWVSLGVGFCGFGLVPLILLGTPKQSVSGAIASNWFEQLAASGLAVDAGEQTAASQLSPNLKAFLDMIAWAEGTQHSEGYRTQYTGATFIGYQTHPDRVRCSYSNGRRLCSSAAGRYQFLQPTFERISKKLGLTDFSPISQDLAAVELIREQEAVADIEAGNIKAALYKVAPIWVHIEGAGYGQPEYTLDELETVFWQQRKKYQ